MDLDSELEIEEGEGGAGVRGCSGRSGVAKAEARKRGGQPERGQDISSKWPGWRRGGPQEPARGRQRKKIWNENDMWGPPSVGIK
jgi:hypothetical protein